MSEAQEELRKEYYDEVGICWDVYKDKYIDWLEDWIIWFKKQNIE